MQKKIINLNISFDPEAGAMYIKFSNNKIFKTIELEDEVFVDVDSRRKIIGMEFLNPSKVNIVTQIMEVFKAPQTISGLNPLRLEKAFRELAHAAPSV